MNREQDVLDQMKDIIDPDLGKDIVTLGFIKDLKITEDGAVSFRLELTTPACPVKEQFRSACEKAVSRLPWVTSVGVALSAQARRSPMQARSPGLEHVANIIAVSSCKGGVGKSTTAVNLAYCLAQAGAKVGIFDADVYGPSLPTLVRPAETSVYQEQELIVPLEADGVKLMSFGFIPKGPGSGAAIMRGPMVSNVINQLLSGTKWGDLDYLVIDMPPGTGDVQLTLTQMIPITAAVIVTTPQELSFVDVVKGIQMFDKLKVATIAAVENMAYFICPTCDERHEVFGRGAMDRLVEQFGFKHTFEIPLAPEVSSLCDAGRPIVLEAPEHAVSAIYRDLAESVVREISRLQHGALDRPSVTYTSETGIVIALPDGGEVTWAPADLRRRCRCAHCVEEMTGQPLLRPEQVSEDIYPTQISTMGNYAVAISWSDGHGSSVYPYEVLVEAPVA